MNSKKNTQCIQCSELMHLVDFYVVYCGPHLSYRDILNIWQQGEARDSDVSLQIDPRDNSEKVIRGVFQIHVNRFYDVPWVEFDNHSNLWEFVKIGLKF